MFWLRKFVTFVGSKLDSHPSFMQAYEAGVVATWVQTAEELRRELHAGRINDFVIFDTRYQSQEQCRLCHEIRATGRLVICIGCTSSECSPCHMQEQDLLSAILAAAEAMAQGNKPARWNSAAADTTNALHAPIPFIGDQAN